MTTTFNANHDFAVVTADGILFVSAEAGYSLANTVLASTSNRILSEATLTAGRARTLYAVARKDGRLMSTDAAQQILDGEAKLVRLTQRGRSFYRSVKCNPFHYAAAVMARSGKATGYDVVG